MNDKIKSTEDALRWMQDLSALAKEARDACDDRRAAPAELRRRYGVWCLRQGSALGALTALHRAGFVSDVAYNEIRNSVLALSSVTYVAQPQLHQEKE